VKKIVSILLVMVLLVCGAFLTYALAEAPAPAAPAQSAPLVDLTGALVAVVLVIFDFLLAWITRVIVPPIREWLGTHTTEKQRGLLWDAICKLVDAAEQTIIGPGQGARRLAYVEAGLQQRGFTVDNDMIEAAVRRMKQNTRITFADVFDIGKELNGDEIEPIPVDENGEPDLNIEHWSLEQLKGFFKCNGFDDSGFTTREQYMDFLTNPPQSGPVFRVTPEELEAVNAVRDKLHKDVAEEPQEAPQEAEESACNGKDWCDLDENGNAIPEAPEAPESVNE